MASKYFDVTVKPTVPASKQQDGAFSAGDVLFDWTPFQIPKGSARLLNTFVTVRGTDAADQGALDIELFFAKSIDNNAPATLGDEHAAVDSSGWQNNLIGYQMLDHSSNSTGSSDDLVFITTLQSGSRGGGPDVVLTGEPNSGDNVGFDTIYVACITQGAHNFSTTVLARGGTTADGSVAIIETDKGSNDDPDAELIFVPGDVLATTNNTDDRTLGTVKSIAAFGSSKQDITFEAAITSTIADNEEIYNLNPVVLKFSFEK
tara:strand:- start:251 stop:1033 length:783 start_codon:yes stop_codon:yes gene_type:complete